MLTSQAVALPTVPAPGVDPRVLGGILMSFWAVCLPRLLSGQPFTTKNILTVRNRLQVLGPNAVTNPAKMIQVHTFGDGTDGQFVCHPVSVEARGSELAVPGVITVASPQPALARLIDVSPKPFLERHRQFGAVVGVNGTVAPLPVVVRFTQGFPRTVRRFGAAINDAVTHVHHVTTNMVGG